MYHTPLMTESQIILLSQFVLFLCQAHKISNNIYLSIEMCVCARAFCSCEYWPNKSVLCQCFHIVIRNSPIDWSICSCPKINPLKMLLWCTSSWPGLTNYLQWNITQSYIIMMYLFLWTAHIQPFYPHSVRCYALTKQTMPSNRLVLYKCREERARVIFFAEIFGPICFYQNDRVMWLYDSILRAPTI